MESKHKTFRRSDGVVGVGYAMLYGGVTQMSVAWPDCEAKRYIATDLGRHGIEEVVPIEQLAQWTPEEDDQVEPLTIEKLETLFGEPPSLQTIIEQVGLPITGPNEQPPEVLPETSGPAEQTNGAAPEAPGVPGQASEAPPISEAQHIRNYLAEHGSGTANKVVVSALKAQGVNVSSSQVNRVKAGLAPQAEPSAE